MLSRTIFSSGSPAVAEHWGQDGISTPQDSHKKRLLSREPDSPLSGELISTAVPSDVAAAADEVQPVSADGITCHSGLTGASPGVHERLAGATFEQLCNDGSQWSWANWVTKLYRWTLLVIKEVYLILMTLSLPTNFLMVRVLQAYTQHACIRAYLH